MILETDGGVFIKCDGCTKAIGPVTTEEEATVQSQRAGWAMEANRTINGITYRHYCPMHKKG